MSKSVDLEPTELRNLLLETRERTLALLEDLDAAQMMGPRLRIVNPLLWEIGHVAWFQGYWVLRQLRGEAPIRADEDRLYDSIAVQHGTRWDLPLPTREETLDYVAETLARAVDRLDREAVGARGAYLYRLVAFHEMMHGEAFTYTRQTHALPPPRFVGANAIDRARGIGAGGERSGERSGERAGERSGDCPGDCDIPGGAFRLGAEPGEDPFVFDNEKWAHPVVVKPFRIARAPVTNGQFRAFVEDHGYARADLWSEEGWRWRTVAGAEHPVYWRRNASGAWERREFDRWYPLREHLPIIHVSAYEAEAYCAWAGRRLPTEAEWEFAAAATQRANEKRRFPWGEEPPDATRANLDSAAGGVTEVGSCAAGESAFGCRHMIGNVWEWTSDAFYPYPGFVIDPYKEYSAPWMDGKHRVLRGGCWATRGALLRNTWRNFYTPERRDIFSGFRTCAR